MIQTSARVGRSAGALLSSVKRAAEAAPFVEFSFIKIVIGRDHPKYDGK